MNNKKGFLLFLISLCLMLFNAQVFAKGKGIINGVSLMYIVIALVVLVVLYFMYSMYISNKINNKAAESSLVLEEISKTDKLWDEASLINNIEKTFYAIQSAFAKYDVTQLERLVHPKLLAILEKNIEYLKEAGNREFINDAKIECVKIVDVKNYIENEKDTFTAYVEFNSYEYTIDKKGNISTIDNSEEQQENIPQILSEYWTFERENDIWMVIDINREGKWGKFVKCDNVNEK